MKKVNGPSARTKKNGKQNYTSYGPVNNLEEHLQPDWWRRIFNSMYLKTDADVESFEPFYRAKNVRKNKGHGIGLSLVDKIVRLHKAEIKVASTIKKGTDFQVLFHLFNSSLN